jgi:ChrB-like protein
MDWIVLAYTLPPEPSRKRVAAWRRLRKLGAVYMNEGFWFLPGTPHLVDAIREIAADIQADGGTAWAFQASSLLPVEKEALHARFTEARQAEYEEVERQCERFLGHVARAAESGDFGFAKTEEFEEDLEKRQRWLTQIRERDVLGADGYQSTQEKLDECRRALDAYLEQAYRQQS